MPKYYFLEFDKIEEKQDIRVGIQNRITFRELTKSTFTSMFLAGSIFSILHLLVKEDKEKSVNISLLIGLLTVLISLINLLISNQYRFRSFEQAYLNIHHKQLIRKIYFNLNKQYPKLLEDFIKSKDITTIEGFINYCHIISNKGLCVGYTHEMLRQMALHPAIEPELLLDRLNIEEVIKYQLIMHIKNELSKYYLQQPHIFHETCPCHQTDILKKKEYELPNIIAVSTVYNKLEGISVLEPKALNDIFTNHLNGLGFVHPEQIKELGNYPADDIEDKNIMTNEELEEKREYIRKRECMSRDERILDSVVNTVGFFRKRQEFHQRKIEYINKNRKSIKLAKRIVAGSILLESKKEGESHAVLYRCTTTHILFFDSNYGFYKYPSSRVFCREFSSHLRKNYANTEQISLKTMLFKVR